MRLTVDLDSLQLIASASDRKRQTMLEFKRGDSTPLEVQFVRSGVAEELPAGAVLSFGLKENGKYDGGFAVFFDSFSAPSASPDFIYSGTPSLNTTELDTLLAVDGSTANDKVFVDLMGELSWAVADADPVSIRTFIARVNNDVIRGDEDAPTPLPTPEDWLDARAVRFDKAQTLDSGERAQAIANLGFSLSSGGGGVADAGAVIRCGGSGDLTVSYQLTVADANSPSGLWSVALFSDSGEQFLVFNQTSNYLQLRPPANLTGTWDQTLPDQDCEILPSLDQAAEKDHGGITALDINGERHIALWNPTQAKYQGIGLSGAAGAETLVIYDLP